MRVRACWGYLEALPPLPHLASPSHGGTRPRYATAMGGARGGVRGEVVHGKSCACVPPSVGTAGRGRGRCPGRPSRRTGSAAGRWVACRNPAVIRDWGDPWPVASARGIRSPSQEILGSASLLCIPHDCFSQSLGPLGEAGRGKAEPEPGQLMGSGYFHFWRGCWRWMVFVVLVGAVGSHWRPVDEARCPVLALPWVREVGAVHDYSPSDLTHGRAGCHVCVYGDSGRVVCLVVVGNSWDPRRRGPSAQAAHKPHTAWDVCLVPVLVPDCGAVVCGLWSVAGGRCLW